MLAFLLAKLLLERLLLVRLEIFECHLHQTANSAQLSYHLVLAREFARHTAPAVAYYQRYQ